MINKINGRKIKIDISANRTEYLW